MSYKAETVELNRKSSPCYATGNGKFPIQEFLNLSFVLDSLSITAQEKHVGEECKVYKSKGNTVSLNLLLHSSLQHTCLPTETPPNLPAMLYPHTQPQSLVASCVSHMVFPSSYGCRLLTQVPEVTAHPLRPRTRACRRNRFLSGLSSFSRFQALLAVRFCIYNLCYRTASNTVQAKFPSKIYAYQKLLDINNQGGLIDLCSTCLVIVTPPLKNIEEVGQSRHAIYLQLCKHVRPTPSQ